MKPRPEHRQAVEYDPETDIMVTTREIGFRRFELTVQGSTLPRYLVDSLDAASEKADVLLNLLKQRRGA